MGGHHHFWFTTAEHDALEEPRRVLVREVAAGTTDPTLQRKRVGPGPQALEVVVGLEHQEIAAGVGFCHPLVDAAAVGEDADTSGAIGNDEADRLFRIVGQEHRLDLEGAYAEGAARQHALRFELGDSSRAARCVEGSAEPTGRADVVRMVVGDQDRVERIYGGRSDWEDQRQPAIELLFGKAGVDEEARDDALSRSLEIRGVASGSAAK